MALINRFSHLFFSSTPPEPKHLLGLPDGGRWGPCAASVVVVPGETYAFYLAPTEGINVINNAVDLYTNQLGGSITGVAELSPVEVFPGLMHYKVSLRVPANIPRPNGYYRLMIQTSAGRIYSNRIWLRRSDYEETTALFSFRNNRAIGPIAYDLPEMANFRQVLRLKCQAGEPGAETQIEDYKADSTGRRRIVEETAESFIPFFCPKTDAFGHEGFKTMLTHKDLLINSVPVSLKTGYSPGDEGRLSTGTFEVWDSEYALVNRC